MQRLQLWKHPDIATIPAANFASGAQPASWNMNKLPVKMGDSAYVPHLATEYIVVQGTVTQAANAAAILPGDWLLNLPLVQQTCLGTYLIQLSMISLHRIQTELAELGSTGCADYNIGTGIPQGGNEPEDFAVTIVYKWTFIPSRTLDCLTFLRPNRAWYDGQLEVNIGNPAQTIDSDYTWKTGSSVTATLFCDMLLSEHLHFCPDFEWREVTKNETDSTSQEIEPGLYHTFGLVSPAASGGSTVNNLAGSDNLAPLVSQIYSDDYPWRFNNKLGAVDYARVMQLRGAFPGNTAIYQFSSDQSIPNEVVCGTVPMVSPRLTGCRDSLPDFYHLATATWTVNTIIQSPGLSNFHRFWYSRVRNATAAGSIVMTPGCAPPTLKGADTVRALVQQDMGTGCGGKTFLPYVPLVPCGGQSPGVFLAAMLPHVSKLG